MKSGAKRIDIGAAVGKNKCGAKKKKKQIPRPKHGPGMTPSAKEGL
jgi:hypothetical protein